MLIPLLLMSCVEDTQYPNMFFPTVYVIMKPEATVDSAFLLLNSIDAIRFSKINSCFSSDLSKDSLNVIKSTLYSKRCLVVQSSTDTISNIMNLYMMLEDMHSVEKQSEWFELMKRFHFVENTEKRWIIEIDVETEREDYWMYELRKIYRDWET